VNFPEPAEMTEEKNSLSQEGMSEALECAFVWRGLRKERYAAVAVEIAWSTLQDAARPGP